MTKIPSKIKDLNIKKISLFLLGMGIFVLVGYNAKDLIFGAPLKIVTAVDGSTVYDMFLPIKGVSSHARELSINGRLIGVDKEGAFADGVLLSPGYNVVEVALRDQFGNKKVKQYRIVVESKEETVAQNNPSSSAERKDIINSL